MDGYYYVAKGGVYVVEATEAAKRLRRWAPEAKIAITCDRGPAPGHPFDMVDECPDDAPDSMLAGLRYKVMAVATRLPFERTLFLDTDTHVLRPVDDVFDLLGHVDVAVVPAPNGTFEGVPHVDGVGVPSANIHNTGVIGLRQSPATRGMLADWYRRFSDRIENEQLLRFETDQRSFAEAVLASVCRVHSLANEWNFRLPFFVTACAPVRIAHGRHEDPGALDAELNASPLQHRCWNPMTREVNLLTPK